MRHSSTNRPAHPAFRRRALVLAVASIATAGSAHAFEIETGNPDLSMRWDNTIRYNVGMRAESQNREILGNPNFDDGDRNFNNGSLVTNRFDVLSKTGAIYFRSGSARLDPASRPVLDSVLDVVAKCPTLKVQVSGHTDSDGSDTQNQVLSERRAGSVREYIVNAGIAAERIAAVGYGESRPIVANDTDKNKSLNRRIEFSATEIVN